MMFWLFLVALIITAVLILVLSYMKGDIKGHLKIPLLAAFDFEAKERKHSRRRPKVR